MWSLLFWWVLMQLGKSNLKLSKSLSHVSEKHIFLKVKSNIKNFWKFSKFFSMLQIFRWKTENKSVTGFSGKFWKFSNEIYTVSKCLIFLLKNSSQDHTRYLTDISFIYHISFVSFDKLYFKVLRVTFVKLLSTCIHFILKA